MTRNWHEYICWFGSDRGGGSSVSDVCLTSWTDFVGASGGLRHVLETYTPPEHPDEVGSSLKRTSSEGTDQRLLLLSSRSPISHARLQGPIYVIEALREITLPQRGRDSERHTTVCLFEPPASALLNQPGLSHLFLLSCTLLSS